MMKETSDNVMEAITGLIIIGRKLSELPDVCNERKNF